MLLNRIVILHVMKKIKLATLDSGNIPESQNKVCKWSFLWRMLMYFILVDTFRCYIISYQSHDAERSGSYVSLSVSVNGSWKVYFRPFLFQHIFSSVKNVSIVGKFISQRIELSKKLKSRKARKVFDIIDLS